MGQLTVKQRYTIQVLKNQGFAQKKLINQRFMSFRSRPFFLILQLSINYNTSLNFSKVHFSKIQASDNQHKIKYLILLKSSDY